MRNIQSSRTFKLAQLQLRLATLIIQIKEEEKKINLKTVTKRAGITGRKWWLPLDITTLIQQKNNAIKEYRL